MYIHLGEDILVQSDDILGIFDLDTATLMKSTREYLKKATKDKKIINVSYDLPKSFIISAREDYRVYISVLSSATISSRAKNKSRRFE